MIVTLNIPDNTSNRPNGWTYDFNFIAELRDNVESLEDDGYVSEETVESVIKELIKKCQIFPNQC